MSDAPAIDTPAANDTSALASPVAPPADDARAPRARRLRTELVANQGAVESVKDYHAERPRVHRTHQASPELVYTVLIPAINAALAD